jgi:MraZ protein
MSTFIGKYEAKADVKGRIFIPSAYRKLLPNGEKERVVMRKDAENDCLVLFPEQVWNEKVEDFKSRLDEWNPVDQLLLMQFVSDAEWLDIDSQGRVLISKKNLQAIGVENAEVLFVGMIDRFAVWSKTRYEKAKLSSSDFAILLKERMMKPKITTPNA